MTVVTGVRVTLSTVCWGFVGLRVALSTLSIVGIDDQVTERTVMGGSSWSRENVSLGELGCTYGVLTFFCFIFVSLPTK